MADQGGKHVEEIEEIVLDGSDESDGEDSDCIMEEEVSGKKKESKGKVYLPQAKGDEDGEAGGELECDESAYILYHQFQTGAPSLSFDVIADELGENRTQYPMTAYLVSGSQADRSHGNHLIVMKMSNLHRNKENKGNSDGDDDESSSDEDDLEKEQPDLECAQIRHNGCVNRVRATTVNGKVLAASWSELGKVHVWDLTVPLNAVSSAQQLAAYVQSDQAPKPLQTFAGHQVEGFAVDWSTQQPGHLATGDCKRNIHLWKPQDAGTWIVDQRPYVGHTASVEEIQWSPSEANVFASGSVDKSIRIWDSRAAPSKACMLTTENAHDSDVNVLSWNKKEPFIASGGDDGVIKVWDLRQFQTGKPVAVFKHHSAPITSVEWNPNDSTVFAASGADDQLTLWDLAVERDPECGGTEEGALAQLPPQLLFIHQGQKDIKELHWHPQLPEVLVSTALSGFNIFKTISV